MLKEFVSSIRHTMPRKSAAAVRFMLGLIFLMSGVMKFIVPELRAAFSGQLMAADIPFHSLNMWFVPAMEIVVGVLFLLGFFARLAGLVSILMMAVATYVHLVANDPSLFPLQPEQPIIPIAVILLCSYVLQAGSGSWSLDLKNT